MAQPLRASLQPMAAVAGARVAGAIAIGRQVTAPPETYRRPWVVGRHHRVTMDVTVKGAQALIKVYTDIRVTADLAEATYGPGLEPIIMQVALSCPPARACCTLHYHWQNQLAKCLLPLFCGRPDAVTAQNCVDLACWPFRASPNFLCQSCTALSVL